MLGPQQSSFVCVCAHARVEARDQHYVVCLSLQQDTTVHLGGKILQTPGVKREIKTTECSKGEETVHLAGSLSSRGKQLKGMVQEVPGTDQIH